MEAFDIYHIEWNPQTNDISSLCPICYIHLYQKGKIRETVETEKGIVCRYCGMHPNDFGKEELETLKRMIKGK